VQTRRASASGASGAGWARNAATVERMLAAVSRGDVDGYLACVHTDVVVRRAVDPDVVITEVRGDNAVRDSDRRYRNHSVMFVGFRDDRVVHWIEYSNPLVYREATDS
jgi:ketosteroid isomerase-like protein